jgi:hypothetical protein
VIKLFHVEALENTICLLKALLLNVSLVVRGLAIEFFQRVFGKLDYYFDGKIARILSVFSNLSNV